MTTVRTGSFHGVSVLHLQCVHILTGEVCGGTVLEVYVETERVASPGTAKHQVTPLWTCGLEYCNVMLLVLRHKLVHVLLLYSSSVHIFFRIWGSGCIFCCTNWKSV